jgi:hypothetical protein
MSPLVGLVAALFLATACGRASAQSASFGLSLRVLPEATVDEAPLDLPKPPQAQVLPSGRHASRLLYGGSADEAKRFYDSALPDLGFQLMQRKSNGAVWERGSVRAELQFYPVAGAEDATGILVMMCRLGASPQPHAADGVPAMCDA